MVTATTVAMRSNRVREGIRWKVRVFEKPNTAPITAKAQNTDPLRVEAMKNLGNGQ
jgi:hypothetical protein